MLRRSHVSLVAGLPAVTPNDVLKEIQALTADLISTGLCIDQNFPCSRATGGVVEIDFGKDYDLSLTLKNVPYEQVYEELSESRSFNLKLIDGGLVQLLYRFTDSALIKHRLGFFPSPDLLEYQNNSEIYEEDELYGDVIDRNVVTVPVRFDFDPDTAVDYEHPASHMSLGQYKNCRIPVVGALSPFLFMNFVLRSFYNTPFRRFCSEIRESDLTFAATITEREQRHVHIGMRA